MNPSGDRPRPHSGANELGDFSTASRRIVHLALAAVLVGVAAAFIAVALLDLIGLFTNLFYYGRLSDNFLVSPAGNKLGWWALAIPIGGGLVVGLLARFGSERIRGHGIPEAIEAILINKSKIEPKVTVLKPVATAISIGSGGPFGAEGPIIMTGGAFGSVFGQLLKVSSAERKTLLVAGAAAGMAAVFNSPLAAVLLAVELLLFEWKPRSLIPVGTAVVVSTALRWELLGDQPLFALTTPLPTGITLASALVVGLVAGGASILLTWGVYASEDAFRRLPLHWTWWPALGGLAIGLGGLLEPRALGVGYTSIDAVLLAQLGLSVILGLLLVKAVIWAISLGSGTSGGVLAPIMMVGACVGALLSVALPGGSLTLFAVVGIGAMIGGAMRSPFTGVVFSLELTHDLPALLPLLVAALAADAVTVLLMKRSILTEKVARRGVHVAREYSVDPLERVPVRAVMRTALSLVPQDLTVAKALEVAPRMEGGERGLVLLSDVGTTVGLVVRGDLLRFVELGGDPRRPLRELAVPLAEAVYRDEPMREAAERLGRLTFGGLPVVDAAEPGHVVGFVTRESPFDARVLWNEIDQRKERMLSVPSLWPWANRPSN